MTSVQNQGKGVYNGYGQLTQQYQATGGSVNTGTSPVVQYGYSQPSGANYSRLTSMTYPNGRVEDYGYNSGVDATISRVSTIADDAGSSAGTVAAYTYLGLSTIVQEAEGNGVELTYIQQTGDSSALTDGGDRYTGLDRFGRVDDQFYVNTSTGAAVDRIQYGYDRDGNVLYANNLVSSSFSELYHANSSALNDDNSAYDPLNRLTSFRRGTLTPSGNNGSTTLDTITSGNLNSTSGVPNTNSWNYDALGNWSSSAPGGTSESNTFNSQNEETANGSNTLTYDNAGEMTRDELGNGYTFDAWGHVVSTTAATFQYDALGRNVISNTGTGNQPTFYDAAGRQIQVFLSYNRGIYTQNVWGLAYVNDLILRDRNADTNNSTGSLGVSGSGLEERLYAQHDSQFSVISLTNASGTVLQRFAYDPYGADTVLTAAWGTTIDGYSWICTFQGMTVVVNGTSHNLLQSQSRLYDVDLGRWKSQDWARYVDGANLYQSELSDPLVQVDPAGLASGQPQRRGGNPIDIGGKGGDNVIPGLGTIDVWTGAGYGYPGGPNQANDGIWIQFDAQPGSNCDCHWYQFQTTIATNHGKPVSAPIQVEPGLWITTGDTTLDVAGMGQGPAFGYYDAPQQGVANHGPNGSVGIWDKPDNIVKPGMTSQIIWIDDYLVCNHQVRYHVSYKRYTDANGQHFGSVAGWPTKRFPKNLRGAPFFYGPTPTHGPTLRFNNPVP